MLSENLSNTLIERWSPILEGITDDEIRQTTAVLLENQAKSILGEAQKDGQLDEATTVGNLGTFQKFAFPLVRRVFPELISNKIVGVQPMQGPVSQVFYLGYNRAGADADGNPVSEQVYSRHQLVYGGRSATSQSNVGAIDAHDGLGNYHYSGLSGAGQTLDASATVGGQIAAFPKADIVGPQYFVSAGERLSGSGIPEVNFTIEQQAVTARTRKFRALWTIEASQDLKAYHNLDLERELTDLLAKEVALEIDRENIENLRNLAYDFDTKGGFNREWLNQPEANNFAADGWGDAGAMGDMKFDQPFGQGGGGVVAGSNPGDGDAMPTAKRGRNVFFVDFGTTALGLAPRHIGEVYANLLGTLNFAAQDIYKTTLRGAGNFIVCSPFIAAMLSTASKLEGGLPADSAGQLGASVVYKGKFMGQYDVYVDPLYPEDEILMGYKGASPMDAGFMYCPYIPVQMLPTITDPETFQPRKGLITRYGSVEVNPASRFYRIVRIIGADSSYLTTPFRKAERGGDLAY